MITLVVSGGQTGADQAGWRGAQACDIPTGGWMPLHFMTENGPDGSLGRLYSAKAMPEGSYAARTARNVRESDGTIWFGSTDSAGAKATLKACELGIWQRFETKWTMPRWPSLKFPSRHGDLGMAPLAPLEGYGAPRSPGEGLAGMATATGT
jgi:hypothetical protein